MQPRSVAHLQVDTLEQISIAKDLFQEYASALGIDLEYQGFAAELAALPAPYEPPRGALFIAYVDSAVAGCVALRPLNDGAAEMKRLYVRPSYRSSGVGNYLVDAVIDAARQASFPTLRLDTLASMTSAQALYRKLGFVETAPYNDKYLPGTRFFSLDLKGET
jgi:ribosomal protein S18 acetylase RimI-like enzyme